MSNIRVIFNSRQSVKLLPEAVVFLVFFLQEVMFLGANQSSGSKDQLFHTLFVLNVEFPPHTPELMHLLYLPTALTCRTTRDKLIKISNKLLRSEDFHLFF